MSTRSRRDGGKSRLAAALAVPAAVWALGIGAYVLAETMIEDRAIALIFAAVLLVSLAPLASGGGARRGQA